MKKHSEKLEMLEKFCADSEMTEEDALELGRKVNRSMYERYHKDIEFKLVKVDSEGVITLPAHLREGMGLKTGTVLGIARFGEFIVMMKDIERLKEIESIIGAEADCEITQEKLMSALRQTKKCPECGKTADYCPSGHWLCFECGWQTEGCDYD
jgi:bifunctional DNA-binding transcriptional regulator/antitoxin component of YhaV-PrlF toxin-antitoxin module